MLRKCKYHGETEFYKDRKNIESWRCKKCNNVNVRKSRKETINKIKLEAGGKCIKCGYFKCLRALEFHHRDPIQKKFQISSGNTRAYNKLKEESKKCNLICANCHRELHNNKE